jgi:hypothetical protein
MFSSGCEAITLSPTPSQSSLTDTLRFCFSVSWNSQRSRLEMDHLARAVPDLEKVRGTGQIKVFNRVLPMKKQYADVVRRDWSQIAEAISLVAGWPRKHLRHPSDCECKDAKNHKLWARTSGAHREWCSWVKVFLIRILNEGPKALSSYCHSWRAIALGDTVPKDGPQRAIFRGKNAENLFAASTLKRSVRWKISATQKCTAEEEACERWMTSSNDIVMDTKSIDRFFDQISHTLRRTARDPIWPLPNDKSCLERSTREGGVAGELHEWIHYLNEAAEFEKPPNEWSHLAKSEIEKIKDGLSTLSKWHESVDYALDDDYTGEVPLELEVPIWDPETGERTNPAMVIDLEDSQSLTVRLIKSKGDIKTVTPTWAQVANTMEDEYDNPFYDYEIKTTWNPKATRVEMLYSSMAYLQEPTVKPLALEEAGGKIRLASLHPATHAYISRALTKRVLPCIKGLVAHRSILTDRPICLRRSGKHAKLYSADLSAATDWIPHEVAQYFWKKLCEHLGEPEWVREHGHRLLGPHKIVKEGIYQDALTKRGVHMGLGHGWTILNLINSWAAWQAGCSKESYQIMGDDLIGFWNPIHVFRYEEALQSLGLKINRSKAFYAERGVFCERLITMDNRKIEATGNMKLTLSEASGAAYGWGVSDTWSGILVGLRRYKNQKDPLYKLSRVTMDRLSLNSLPTGPLFMGGKGTGAPTAELCVAFLTEGTVQLETHTHDATIRKLKPLHKSERPSNGYSVDEAKEILRYGIQARDVLDGKIPHKTTPFTKRRYQGICNGRIARARARIGTRDLFTTVRDALREKTDPMKGLSRPKCGLSQKARSHVMALLIRDKTLKKTKTRKAMAKLFRDDLTRYVTEEDLQALVLSDGVLLPTRQSGSLYGMEERHLNRSVLLTFKRSAPKASVGANVPAG